MSTLLYDNKTWIMKSKNGRKIQGMDMKPLTDVKGCNKLDKINN
jgi:hypothetical protein